MEADRREIKIISTRSHDMKKARRKALREIADEIDDLSIALDALRGEE
jgi:hypothetical protein